MATKLINYNDIHTVCESSYLGATYGDGRILSMEINQDIDNGKLLAKGKYLRPEVYQGVVPTAANAVYLVLNPPLIAEEYTSAMQAEKYYYNEAMQRLRCYPLQPTDVFTVSEIGITKIDDSTELAVGQFVIANGVDLQASATAPDTNGFVGEIIEKVRKHDGFRYRIEVKKNTEVAGA